ncbi:hypothetical protein [Microlunatus sp. GCM10028923]|uniref:hypothetical protein n=1 Tax=Microlunatus sp. GCM10028923 TaxID=3273400 RepID=UPI00360EAF79
MNGAVSQPDYRSSRQRHLGQMLDQLDEQGVLSWEWRYDHTRSAAIFMIANAASDGPYEPFTTGAAEALVQTHCDLLEIAWRPVPAPGGRRELDQTMEWIRRHGG